MELCKVERFSMRICARRGCNSLATIVSGQTPYCPKHRRMVQMKSDAKKRHKIVPSDEVLESLFTAIEDMCCPICGTKMTYFRENGIGARVITLQHDDSGELRLICLACNVKHAQFGGDVWYFLEDGYYRCICCQEIKPFEDFYHRKDNSNQIYTRCKECERARKRKPTEEQS